MARTSLGSPAFEALLRSQPWDRGSLTQMGASGLDGVKSCFSESPGMLCQLFWLVLIAELTWVMFLKFLDHLETQCEAIQINRV